MRRLLLPLLLLSASAPALAAQPEDNDARLAREARADVEIAPRAERPDRSPRSEPRRARSERPERAERPQTVERAQPQVERPQPAFERPEPAFERAQRRERAERSPQVDPVERQERRQRREGPAPAAGTGETRPADSVGSWRWQERNAERRRRAETSPAPTPSPVLGDSIRSPREVTRPVGSVQERRIGSVLRNRIATEGWRREWRRDRNYDWRRHRDRDRSRFHLGIYIDPFGWGYRRWQVGWSLYPRFYSDRYWIDEPWEYRLPPVYGPYRWVRYYDDVLLVDLRSGRVVDVIYNFFW